MPENNSSKQVKWAKVADIKYVTDAFCGILAVGQSGICSPIEGVASFKDTGFLSCAPYFNGHILIAENTTVIETYESKSETKWPYEIIDAATIGTITYIVSRHGEIFYSEKFGEFGKCASKYDTFNSINACGNYFVMSGAQAIVINDSRESNRNTLINITISGVDFKSAYIYNECELVALLSDNRIMYMPDFKDTSKTFVAAISDIIDVDINQIYIYTNNLYLLCNDGYIVLLKDFKLSDTGNDLDIYAARFGAPTDWTSMIHVNDNTNRSVVVGNGRLDKSILKISDFDKYIIENDILNSKLVKGVYPHLVNMIDSYENGCVMYSFHNILPTIDILDKILSVDLKELIGNKSDTIDWSNATAYVTIDKPSINNTIYQTHISDNGILTVNISDLHFGHFGILLLFGRDNT